MDEIGKKNLQRLKELRPIDDEFMRCLFRENIPLAQLVLRIIMGKDDLEIIGCHTQEDMKRLVGARSICLDVYGTDSENKKYDIEVQRASKGARPHRARYHSSVMDVENLNAGQEFEELPETYTIFITEEDFFGKGKPVYRVERMNLDADGFFDDGEHILYVNGEYRSDTDIGMLMHDFNCTNADDMHYKLMADRTRYLKKTQKGVSEVSEIVSEIVEEMCNEREMEAKRKIARTFILMGELSYEKIAKGTDLPIEEIEKMAIEENIEV